MSRDRDNGVYKEITRFKSKDILVQIILIKLFNI